VIDRKRFKLYRQYRGLSQRALAKKSGVCEHTIVNIETGIQDNSTTRTLGKLAVALEIPLEHLFREDA